LHTVVKKTEEYGQSPRNINYFRSHVSVFILYGWPIWGFFVSQELVDLYFLSVQMVFMALVPWTVRMIVWNC